MKELRFFDRLGFLNLDKWTKVISIVEFLPTYLA